MLKKSITYTDYNGVTRTEDFYFNLAKHELVKLEISREEGFHAALQKILDSGNGELIMDTFEDFIVKSYGVREDEGRRFRKSPELSQAFMQTEAYDVLFMELVTNPVSAAEFVNGMMPADLEQAVAAMNTGQVAQPTTELRTINEPADKTVVATYVAKKPEDMTRDELLAFYKHEPPVLN